MSLEEDIGQKDFHSEYHKAVLNPLTSRFLVDRMNDLLKKYDITVKQYNVLRILRGQLLNQLPSILSANACSIKCRTLPGC